MKKKRFNMDKFYPKRRDCIRRNWMNDIHSRVLDVIPNPISKLRKHITDYSIAYDHHGAHRTSNMLDRLMQRMNRHLFSTQYFHGSMASAELSIRGWALIQNFALSNPQTIRKHQNFQSPAERLTTSFAITKIGYTTL